MKIAQIAPLFESVPARGYGGTERIVSYLTEELVGCAQIDPSRKLSGVAVDPGRGR
jgi:hypothetical protein